MIVSFLGKGGSGKSTLATQFSLYLHKQGSTVLAIDGDHNMDLTFNLTNSEQPKKTFGDSLPALNAYCKLKNDEHYSQLFKRDSLPKFNLNPKDLYTKNYSDQIRDRLHLMTAGPQTDRVLYGQACSHSLTTPLKIYLPLLHLNQGEYVILDEKAGADGVSTGIVTGVDVGVIVFEPTLHSIKTAKQIAGLMDFYKTPYLFVANKFTSTDINYIEENLNQPFLSINTVITLKQSPGKLVTELEPNLQNLLLKLKQTKPEISRNIRSGDKFARNEVFNASIKNI